jgi:O-antigen ligase
LLPYAEMAMGLFIVVVGLKLPFGSLRTMAMLALCGLVTIYGILRNPYAPLYCFAFITPISKAFGTDFALMFGSLVAVWLRRDICQWRWRFSLPGTAYCLWGVASLLWAGEIFTDWDSWIAQALGPMLLAFLVAGLRDTTFRRNLMLLVTVACCIGIIFSFRNWHAGTGEYGSGGRFYALIPPDPFSAWILFGLFSAIAWLADGGAPVWLRCCLLASIPWQVLGLGLCGFRAAILAAALGVVMVGICLRRLAKLTGLLTLAAIPVVAAAVLIPGLFNTLLGRFGTIATDQGSDRLVIWAGALKKFWDHPFIGYGLDNFKALTGGFYGDEMMPHSIYVGTLVELGAVGAVLLLVWMAVLLRKAWRAQERVWIFPLMVAFSFQAMFLHEFYFPCFWLAIALVEGARLRAPALVGTRRWRQLPEEAGPELSVPVGQLN